MLPSAVHFSARVSGPSQHTWPEPPQGETHLFVVMSQPKPRWQLTSGPKAGTFWNGARQQDSSSAPHQLLNGKTPGNFTQATSRPNVGVQPPRVTIPPIERSELVAKPR